MGRSEAPEVGNGKHPDSNWPDKMEAEGFKAL